jgi:hypothetical protein
MWQSRRNRTECPAMQVKEVPELRRQTESLQEELSTVHKESADFKKRFLQERSHRRTLHEHLQARTPAMQ